MKWRTPKVDLKRQELCLLRLWCRCGRALQGQGGDLDLGWNGSVRNHRLFASNPRKVSGNWIGVFLIVDYVDWLSQHERSLGISSEFRRKTQVLFFEVVLVVVKLWGTKNAEVSETWLRLSEVRGHLSRGRYWKGWAITVRWRSIRLWVDKVIVVSIYKCQCPAREESGAGGASFLVEISGI